MKVLFVCKNNAERSQIAEAIFNRLSRGSSASSAGVEVDKEGEAGLPPGRVATELMLGWGYDLLKKKRKQLTRRLFDRADIVVVILSSGEIRKLLPRYAALSPKTRFWVDRLAPKSIYTSYPPHTYSYHINGLRRIYRRVMALVKETG
jgi:protein-tyrosine-phosphatase